MPEAPFHLQYVLTRWQRLLPHLRIWGTLSLLAPLVLAGLLWALPHAWWLLPLPLAWFWLFRGFFIGVIDALLHPRVSMDLQVEEKGLGLLAGGERWWLFLDGILSVEQLVRGIWTVQRFNGTVIHIPADAISASQVGYLQQAAARGRDPEVIQAVIERGRRIESLQRQERL